MKIVTSGSKFLDIDAYAGCIAYAELLRLLGHEARAVATAPQNSSVTATVRSWPADLQTTYTPAADDTYILVDVSDPNFFEKFVDLERVEEVIDHHPNNEKHWQQKLGEKCRIEFIGAACTLVYERWVAEGKADHISETSARLLLTGILDNTLNFGALVTSDRDHQAYEALMDKANLSHDWPAAYFSECQTSIENDFEESVHNDLKVGMTPLLPHVIGQLVIWDAQELIAKEGDKIAGILGAISPDWMMNVVSISESKSHFRVGSAVDRQRLERILGVRFSDGQATADRMWLRKEMLKAAHAEE